MSDQINPASFSHPYSASAAASEASFSHDSRYVTFLQETSSPGELDLKIIDCETGVEKILLTAAQIGAWRQTPSLAEELAMERARRRYIGITSFSWVHPSHLILVLISNLLVFIDALTSELTVCERGAYIETAQINSNGTQVVYCSAGDLWLQDVPVSGYRPLDPRKLTAGSTATIFYGVPDQISREEIFNGAPYLWCSHDQKILFATYDVSGVKSINISDGAQTSVQLAYYSVPGQNVATFDLSVLDLESGSHVEILAADGNWPYLLGMQLKDDNAALVARLNRDQTTLQFLWIDLSDGAVKIFYEDTQLPWINFNGFPVFTKTNGAFFLVREKSGVGRIALFDTDCKPILEIDSCGHVERIIGLTQDNSGVYYVDSQSDGLVRHIYLAEASSEWVPKKITLKEGTNSALIAPDGSRWLRSFDSVSERSHAWVEQISGGVAFHLTPTKRRSFEAGFIVPELLQVPSANGDVSLNVAIYEPSRVAEAGGTQFPVILFVYGGPHAQSVRDSWATTADLRAQFLVQNGFVVVKIDNRGTAGRGHFFETPLYGRLGAVETQDQCTAVEHLLGERTYLDRHRVGVCGWSYGGYMALRCMQERPDLFIGGIAGAPVVNWEEYDAPYTERYMGSPNENAWFLTANKSAYSSSSALHKISALSGALFVIHGMKDENVLFRHTAALIEAMAYHGRTFELLVLPSERHSIRTPTNKSYLEERILNFLLNVI